ncbi:hypothetical protein S460_22740 [Salmonella enterica subsp. diarizonae]|nr:hypothetical protein [Salmonella enterica subsp. diarizonae]EDQ3623647.1 hypothetical protein [Salmonella enterica subsp. diarizonae]
MIKKYTVLALPTVVKKCAVLPLAAVVKKCTVLALAVVVKKCTVLPRAMDKSKFQHPAIWFSIVLLPLAEDYLNPD